MQSVSPPYVQTVICGSNIGGDHDDITMLMLSHSGGQWWPVNRTRIVFSLRFPASSLLRLLHVPDLRCGPSNLRSEPHLAMTQASRLVNVRVDACVFFFK